MQNSKEKINTLESTLNANELNRQNTFEEFSQRINNEFNEANTGYQKKEDQSLSTNSKQVAGAINEIYEDLQNKSEFSGSYNDLTEKPNIPSIDGLATEVYVDDKVASIVNSAPETLDTLNELATALGNDPNFATTVANQIGTKASNDYVNAELAKKVNSEGYVATENNYSTAEKTKLANVEDNANNYVHPENHEPSIIIQDNEHRFVTDTERETWNNKLSEHQDISHLAVKSQVDESLSQINQSNVERDNKIFSIENINSVQNAKLDTLFNSASGEMELKSNTNNIKLDSSKKGTATVNYIKGNTLVNCAKENKELILNDEINVEGTTCTINDTVEGGLVDVELEGLSLNNLYKTNSIWNVDGNYAYIQLEEPLLTLDKKYTVRLFGYTSSVGSYKIAGASASNPICTSYTMNDIVFTFNDTLPSPLYLFVYPKNELPLTMSDVKNIKAIILEGDYTNKPIPTEAFTGIKSVGEEVALTNISNKNGYYSLDISITNGSTNYSAYSGLDINKTYTVKVFGLDLESMTMGVYNSDGGSVPIVAHTKTDTITFKPTSADGTRLYFKADEDKTISCSVKIVLVEGDYENSNLEYFEGSIKKYKIETKSQNDNLFDYKEYCNQIKDIAGVTLTEKGFKIDVGENNQACNEIRKRTPFM